MTQQVGRGQAFEVVVALGQRTAGAGDDGRLRNQRLDHAVELQRHRSGGQIDDARLGDQREQVAVDSDRHGIGVAARSRAALRRPRAATRASQQRR